jgi:hypothetical protein
MIESKHTLELLGPVPTGDGECRRRVIHEPPRVDWVEVRVVLDGGTTGRRVVTALFDADDRPGAVCDVVTIPGGERQQMVSGEVATGGLIRGTYSGPENDQQSSRPLTETETQRLRGVFASLRQRYP